MSVLRGPSGNIRATYDIDPKFNRSESDPAVNAPLSHGKPTTTFIGDYFGLAASTLGFFPFWTDTRTGIQEIFSARLTVNQASRYQRDPLLVFFHIDNPAGENRGFYRVAKALRRDGRVPASAIELFPDSHEVLPGSSE